MKTKSITSPQVNQGFLSRTKEILANQPSFTNSSVWKLNMEKGYPYSVGILNPTYVDLMVHYIKGQAPTLCNLMYFEPGDADAVCADCAKPGFNGQGTNKAAVVRCLLGYVFDHVGKKGTTKMGKEFSYNPVAIIEVSAGKAQTNFIQLNEAVLGNYLTFENGSEPNVWKFKRRTEAEGGGMAEPSICPRPEIKKLMGMYNLAIPEETLKEWSSKSQGEILGHFLSQYGNVNKELLSKDGIVFPTTTEKEKSTADFGDEVDSSLDS